MFKKLCLLTTSLVLVGGGTVWAEDPTPYNCDFSPSCEVSPGIYGAMGSPVMSKFKMSIGGYVKMDYAHNSNAAGPRLTGPPTYVAAGTPSKDESVITPKQSRVWLKVAGPTFMGAKTNALVEIDFYGGSFAGGASNESSLARMRHAYGTIDWTNTQILFGQLGYLGTGDCRYHRLLSGRYLRHPEHPACAPDPPDPEARLRQG